MVFRPFFKQIKSQAQKITKFLVTLDRRIIMFLIFVIISTFLWFMNALSDKYITDIEIPVSYYNIPDNYVMVGDYPEYINVQVSGRGFTLLKYTIGSLSLPFRFNLEPYFQTSSESEDKIRFQYYISSKKDQVEQFLNDEIKVLDVEPTSVFLNFDKLFTKHIKIEVKSDIRYAEQYRQKGNFIIVPDSVSVHGPKSIIDTIKKVNTRTIEDDMVEKNKEYNVKLVKPTQCNINPKRAKVILTTEQFTENTLQLPIQIINKPDSIKLTIFPENINVKYLISFDDFQSITADNFQAAIDYNQIEKESSLQELKINLLYVPDQVQLLRYWPEKARFIISENK